jgi:hypothetical protein
MTFKQNYLKELPDDILDKIYLFVNKHNFDKCIIDIDNPKIKLFHVFNRMITDSYFDLIYSLSESKKLGWFWNYHKNPMIDNDLDIDDDDDNEKLFAIYDLFHLDKRLSYKDYTTSSPEYTNIKYYRFKYTNTTEFKSWEIPDINRFVKKYFVFDVIEETNILIKRITFKRNYIHIYFKKESYEDTTPLDVAFNISHIYNIITECVMFLHDNYILPFDNTVNYLENNNYLESFEIKDNVLTTVFTDA